MYRVITNASIELINFEGALFLFKCWGYAVGNKLFDHQSKTNESNL